MTPSPILSQSRKSFDNDDVGVHGTRAKARILMACQFLVAFFFSFSFFLQLLHRWIEKTSALTTRWVRFSSLILQTDARTITLCSSITDCLFW